MQIKNDIKRNYRTDKQWYRKVWTLNIKDASWVEDTKNQVDFICDVLDLEGNESVLDLACGFGRHSIELAKRGYNVTGVDITPDFINEAKRQADEQKINAVFINKDIRDLNYYEEFDVVLNMADGAIGYLEDEKENLKIFDIIQMSLKSGGRHLMDIGNAGYAEKHFPCRGWEFGDKTLDHADFEWDSKRKLMLYGGFTITYGEVFVRPESMNISPIRFYNLQELSGIFKERGMEITGTYGDFDKNKQATDDVFQVQVCSQKI